MIKWANDHPKKIFLLDGFGAIVSAILLGIVLARFETIFGIPKPTLYILAALPCLFAMYDFYCYFKIDKKIGLYVTGIAIANLLYCALSIGFSIFHIDKLTNFGWAYIIGEILLVTAIAIWELTVAKGLLKNDKQQN